MKNGTPGTKVKLVPWRCTRCRRKLCNECIDLKRHSVGFEGRVCSCPHVRSDAATPSPQKS